MAESFPFLQQQTTYLPATILPFADLIQRHRPDLPLPATTNKCLSYSILNRNARTNIFPSRNTQPKYLPDFPSSNTQSKLLHERLLGRRSESSWGSFGTVVSQDTVNFWYSTTVLQALALIGSTPYSTNWRRNQYSILNNSLASGIWSKK